MIFDTRMCLHHAHTHMHTHLQSYIELHNQQHVIELDANLPPIELFKVSSDCLFICMAWHQLRLQISYLPQSLLVRLTSLGLPRAPAPKRLLTPEEDEEEPEGIDTEQFMQQITGGSACVLVTQGPILYGYILVPYTCISVSVCIKLFCTSMSAMVSGVA